MCVVVIDVSEEYFLEYFHSKIKRGDFEFLLALEHVTRKLLNTIDQRLKNLKFLCNVHCEYVFLFPITVVFHLQRYIIVIKHMINK